MYLARLRRGLARLGDAYAALARRAKFLKLRKTNMLILAVRLS
jgi:hypothetical protein